uniref:Uncharacterized protein n=1 Tax=Romanomermis culicivorax TaxID=13658 RepID=A0A915JEA7_ROMCU
MQCHSKEKGLSSQRRDIANLLADMATEHKKVIQHCKKSCLTSLEDQSHLEIIAQTILQNLASENFFDFKFTSTNCKKREFKVLIFHDSLSSMPRHLQALKPSVGVLRNKNAKNFRRSAPNQ